MSVCRLRFKFPKDISLIFRVKQKHGTSRFIFLSYPACFFSYFLKRMDNILNRYAASIVTML